MTKTTSKQNYPKVVASALAITLAAGTGVSVLHAQDAAPALEGKKPAWETTAAFGLTLTRGNSETLTGTANILAQKKWDKNELSLGADGTYGEADGTKNAESIHGFGQYNRLFTDRAYGYARVDALHDAVADVDYRLTFSPGAGYYFVKKERTSLSGELGPGVVLEKQGGQEDSYLTLRVAERFEHKFNDRTRVWQSVEWLPQVDDFNNSIINAEIGVETQLSTKFSLRVFAQDTYDTRPAAGRKNNDLKLVTALAYKF